MKKNMGLKRERAIRYSTQKSMQKTSTQEKLFGGTYP